MLNSAFCLLTILLNCSIMIMWIKMAGFCVHYMPIEYLILYLHRIKTIDNVSTQINFQHLNEFAKIRSTKIIL